MASPLMPRRISVAPVANHTRTAHSDETGRGFRFEAGHDSDLKPATVPI
jgi:hypothetical protein